MSKVDDILRSTRPDGAFTMAMLDAKQQLLAEVLEMISSFEVESLPSDDPKIVFWQGYHQAQLDIIEAAKERFS